MPEEKENWWEKTPEEGKEVGDSPEPVEIRGWEKDRGQWVQSKAKDTVVPSSGGASRDPFSDWFPEDPSNFSKQHAVATALFAFSFLVGDWWWDGSNGFLALMHSPTAVIDLIFLDHLKFNPFNGFEGILVGIAWSLWDMTPLVFFLGFASSWRGSYRGEVTSEHLEFRRQNAKRSYRFLVSFAKVLVVMDFLLHMVWSNWNFITIIEYPTVFFSNHFWKVTAFLAVLGLNPDNDLWGKFISTLPSQLTRELAKD